MRAVRSEGGQATVVDLPVPEGPGQRVRIASAGICGSDLHLLKWDLPVVLGHELSGTLPDGTPVAIEPISPCGACEACAAGQYNHCPAALAAIVGVGRDGGMAELCLVPDAAIIRLPAGIPLGDACLIEPLGVAVHGMRRAHVRPGEKVAVVGGGSIGLTAAIAAQAAGAEVDVEARHEHQREAARRLGAGIVPPTAEGRYDAVIEAAGTGEALARSVALSRPGGRILALGTYWDEHVSFPGLELSTKEVDIVPSSMYGRVGPLRDIDAAAALLAGRPEVADILITHRFPLDAAAEAFATASDRGAGAIKVVIEP